MQCIGHSMLLLLRLQLCLDFHNSHLCYTQLFVQCTLLSTVYLLGLQSCHMSASPSCYAEVPLQAADAQHHAAAGCCSYAKSDSACVMTSYAPHVTRTAASQLPTLTSNHITASRAYLLLHSISAAKSTSDTVFRLAGPISCSARGTELASSALAWNIAEPASCVLDSEQHPLLRCACDKATVHIPAHSAVCSTPLGPLTLLVC